MQFVNFFNDILLTHSLIDLSFYFNPPILDMLCLVGRSQSTLSCFKLG